MALYCRFLRYESLTILEAKAYVKAPRMGRATTPFLDTPEGDPPAKKPRLAEEITDGLISEQGEIRQLFVASSNE